MGLQMFCVNVTNMCVFQDVLYVIELEYLRRER